MVKRTILARFTLFFTQSLSRTRVNIYNLTKYSATYRTKNNRIVYIRNNQ